MKEYKCNMCYAEFDMPITKKIGYEAYNANKNTLYEDAYNIEDELQCPDCNSDDIFNQIA